MWFRATCHPCAPKEHDVVNILYTLNQLVYKTLYFSNAESFQQCRVTNTNRYMSQFLKIDL